MTSAIEKLKLIARAVQAPVELPLRRLVASTGLALAKQPAPDLIGASILGRLKPLDNASNIAANYAMFEAMYANKAFCENGFRTYTLAAEALRIRPQLPDEHVDISHFEAWWNRDRTDPAAAALFSQAIITARWNAHEYSDHDTCTQAVLSAHEQARAVLAHAGPRGRVHWLWRRMDYNLLLQECIYGIEDYDLQEVVFAALQGLDPYEFGIYDTLAQHAIIFDASSAAVFEQCARNAIGLTEDKFGRLLYARLYDRVVRQNRDDAAIFCDPARLMLAFDDWYQRFPTQPLANCYAAHAHRLGDFATVQRLFCRELREIHVSCWFQPDQPLQAWQDITA